MKTSKKEIIDSIANRTDRLRDDLFKIPHLSDRKKSDWNAVFQEFKSDINGAGSGKDEIIDDRYKLLFENAPMGIFQYDQKGIITDCNDTFVEMMGSTTQALIGLNTLHLPNKEVVEAIRKSLRGETSKYEGKYTSVTGKKSSNIQAFFAPLSSGSDQIIGGIGILQDYSDLLSYQRALQESEHRYRNLFEKNHAPMLVIDPRDGSIFDANPAAVNFYGWSRTQLKSMNIREIICSENNRDVSERNHTQSGDSIYSQLQHRLADGSIRDVEVNSGTIPFFGKDFLLSIVRDVTRRKKLEKELAKFRLGIERSPNPVFITDVDGVFQYVNPAFKKLYGYNDEELKNATPRILKSGKQKEEFYEKFWTTIKSGNIAHGEIINKTKNGKLLNMLYSSNPIVDENNEIIGYIAIQDNITKRKRIEEVLKESLHEKEVLLTEVHHRVKNNLAMISAMLLLQSEKSASHKLKNKLVDSNNRIKSIANIHEHLYQTNNFSVINFTENTYSLIHGIIESMNPETDVTVTISEEIVKLTIDQSVHCSLIVNEVVSNIVKHAFKGRKTGHIMVNLTERNDIVHLTISDDGHPPDEAFYRQRRETLGLELINLMIKQLGASQEYHIHENGTDFNLTFKRLRSRSSDNGDTKISDF